MKEEDIRSLKQVQEFFTAEAEWLKRYSQDGKFIDDKYTTSVSCPCCNENNSEKLFVKNYFQFVQCRSCATIYVNPRFTQSMIAEYYRTREDRLRYEAVLASDRNEINRIENILLPRRRYVETILGEVDCGDRFPKLLDIGCASGQFLSCFNGNNKIHLAGVEASPELARSAMARLPNVKIINSTLEAADFHDEIFDVITVWEVLEHAFDPHLFMSRIREILHGNGILVMSLPNIEGFDISILWELGNAFSPPSHLNYYRKSSVAELLKRHGFEVVKIATPGLLDVDIVRNRLSVDKSKIQKRLGTYFYDILNNSDQKSESIRQKLQRFLADSGLSSHMILTCRKS